MITRLPDKILSYVESIDSTVTDIDTNVDTANSGITTIAGHTIKIDSAAASGLSGTANSLAYHVGEIERHFHSRERWFGQAASANGEIHVADSIQTSSTAFRIDGGNDTWGAWVQVLGSSDTPAIAGNLYYDPHQIIVTAVERANAVYLISISQGASGDAGYTAGNYSEFVIQLTATTPRGFPLDIQSRRVAVGTKAWARCKCIGQNTGTLDFFYGIHEYEG